MQVGWSKAVTACALTISVSDLSPFCICSNLENPQIVSLDSIREGLTYGRHPCNARSELAALKEEFGNQVNLAGLTETDELWDSGGGEETKEELMRRVSTFLAWLAQRPENTILVVTHCVFLHALFNDVLVCDSECDTDWFLPGEMRSVVLDFQSFGGD
jgi:hypothetical protein